MRAVSTIRFWFTRPLSATNDDDLIRDADFVTRLHAAQVVFQAGGWHVASTGARDTAARAEHTLNLLAGAPATAGGVRTTGGFVYHGLGIAYAAAGRPVEASQAWAAGRALFDEVDHFALIAFTLLDELRDV